MEDHDSTFCLQFCESLLQANGVRDRFLHKLFNEWFPPRGQHSPAETAAKTGDTCEADSCDFDGLAVEHVHTRVIKNFANQLLLPRFEIVVAENGEHWNSHCSTNIGDELLRFFGKSIIGKIAAKQQQISTARYLIKCFMQCTA